MKAIVVTDQAAGTAGMTLVERPEPQAAINDVIVQVHASGFVPTELTWPSTWTDRADRDRTPSIPGHELAGVVTALGYGTTGLSVGQRVFGLTDWHRDGTLAEYVAVEARNLAPLPGDVDFTVGASLPISGLTAWQGLFEHGRLQAGQSVLAHGAAGAVGTMVTQLAREFGAYVIGAGRAADRQKALDFGAQEFVELGNDALEDVGAVDLVFDVIGGDIQKRSAGLIRAGGTLVTIVGPTEARPTDGLAIDFVVESDRAHLSDIVQRVRDGRLRTNVGNIATLDDAVGALNHPRSPVRTRRRDRRAADREFGAYVIGTGRAADSRARGPRAQNFLSVSNSKYTPARRAHRAQAIRRVHREPSRVAAGFCQCCRASSVRRWAASAV
jgi:NADPH:quinone reductase-like Zn-dependent oxidoreductase